MYSVWLFLGILTILTIVVTHLRKASSNRRVSAARNFLFGVASFVFSCLVVELSSLVIEVLSTSPNPLLVDVAAPDDHGRLPIDLPEAVLSSLFGNDRPHLFFRVWSGERLLADTEYTLRWHSQDDKRTFRLELAGPTGKGKPSPHTVRGRVHASALGPGWTVEVLDQPPRCEPVPLGVGEIDEQGAYTLSYSRDRLRPAGHTPASQTVLRS